MQYEMKIFSSIIVFVLLTTGKIISQDTAGKIFHIDSLPAQGVLLDKSWKFHPGDNIEFGKPGFNDSDWEDINPMQDLYYLPQIKKESIGWFRIKLHIDSILLHKPLAFQVSQFLASEIYLNGKLIQRYGLVSLDNKKVKAMQPLPEPFGIQFD